MLSISIRWTVQPYTRQRFLKRTQKWMHKKAALECCHLQKGNQRNLETFHQKRARSERNSAQDCVKLHENTTELAWWEAPKRTLETDSTLFGFLEGGKDEEVQAIQKPKSPLTKDQKERRESWPNMLPCRLSRAAGFRRGSALHPKKLQPGNS